MAGAAAVHPEPTSPPPVGRVVARSRLAAAAADAVTCLHLASMWLLFWALGAWNIGRIACGEGSPMAMAALKVFCAAGVVFALALPFSVIVMAGRTAGAATDIEAVEAPSPKSSAAALREALGDPVVIAVFTWMAFVLLGLVGVLVKGDSPVKGSRRERMGSAIYDVGALSMDILNCFVVCPISTVRVWRTWSMA